MRTHFYDHLQKRIAELGGGFNAHLHLDRAGTLDVRRGTGEETAWAMTLEKKHGLIEWIHSSDLYSEGSIKARAREYLTLIADYGSTQADTFVDVSSDGVGLKSLNALAEVRDELAGRIKLRLGAYNPLGFRTGDGQAVKLLESALPYCDFLGGLPERDEVFRYPDHIGFEDSCRLIYDLAASCGMEVHLHVDQRNDPEQRESERCISALESRTTSTNSKQRESGLWLVHVISPSRYEEDRFCRLADSFEELGVGIICCPSAALSMRQLRGRKSPTSNSIARVLDFLAKGVSVRVGCDNIYDAASPAGTPDIIEEVINLANAERYYDIEGLARIGAGIDFDEDQRKSLAQHLLNNTNHCEQMLQDYIQNKP